MLKYCETMALDPNSLPVERLAGPDEGLSIRAVLGPNLMWLRIMEQNIKINKQRQRSAPDQLAQNMKVGGGVVYGRPRATAFPTVLLGQGRASPRCSYSSFSSGELMPCLVQQSWKCL